MKEITTMAETQEMLAAVQAQLKEMPKEIAKMLEERDSMTPEDVQIIVFGIGGIAKLLREAADALDKGIEGLR